MKRLLAICFLCCCAVCLNAQPISIQLDRMNEFYIGIDNPITVTAANTSYKNIVVKAENGTITGGPIKFTYSASKVGIDILTVYKITKGKLKKLGSSPYRIKRIPPPTFKIANIGSSSPNNKIQKIVLANQSFVRAELEGFFGFDVKYSVDSFTVIIVNSKANTFTKFFNKSNKVSDEIKNTFQKLENEDFVVFKDIFTSGPGLNGSQIISPLILSIKE